MTAASGRFVYGGVHMLSHGGELYGQFILARAGHPLPEGWNTAQLAGWALAAHRLLPIIPIRDHQDQQVGWIIGHAIDRCELLRDPWRLPQSATSPSEFEKLLYEFGGRWVCVILTPQFSRVYVDASATLATVYRTDVKVVGSTPTLLHHDQMEAYRAKKAAEPRLKANQFYPGELTSDDDTKRLLPNHYLDLNTWEPVRHWPLEPIALVSDKDAIHQAQRIVDRTRDNIAAVAWKMPLYMGLSAGRDSRMVLGCAYDVIDAMTFVTFRYKDNDKQADLNVATHLATALRLKHQTLPLNDPPAAQKDEYLHRVGYCSNVGKACDFYDACGSLLKMNHAWLTGYGGEVGRSYYWRPKEPVHRPTAEDLLDRMHLPHNDQNLAAVRKWLASVPDWMEIYGLLDLMYLELRVGCWASPQQYGTAPFAMLMMPFSHRKTYEGIFSLPIEYRRHQLLARDVLQLTWPETLTFPFQQYTGLRRVAHRANALIGRVRRKVGRIAAAVGIVH